MPVVEESVIIARPAQEVFDFLAKYENIPVYDSAVTSAELLPHSEAYAGAVLTSKRNSPPERSPRRTQPSSRSRSPGSVR